MSSLRIDIVADIVCPWSFIGVRRLRRALGAEGRSGHLDHQVYWRPYLLNPDIGPAGADQVDILARTIGPESRIKRFQDTVRRAGAEVGIEFRFDQLGFTPFAVPAHRLIRRFDGGSRVLEAADILFSAYFEEGCNISDLDVLFDCLSPLGYERRDIEAAIRDASLGHDSVVLDDADTQRLGINGVPSFIFAGRHVISGAHDQAVLARMLDVATVVTDDPLSPI